MRFIIASMFSWFVWWIVVAEAIPFLRFVLAGLSLKEDRIIQVLGLYIEPLRVSGSIAIFIVTFLQVRSPLDESIMVLISLVVSYIVMSLATTIYALFREARASNEALNWWLLYKSLLSILWLVSQIHWFVLQLLYFCVFIPYSIVKPQMYKELTKGSVEKLSSFMKQAELDKPRFQITAQGISGLLFLIVLAVAYWIIGIQQLIQFIQFSVYLFLGYVLFAVLFKGMRKPEAAQLRWINPFAIAGSFVIVFSLYVAILRGQADQPIVPYLVTVGVFLIFLWYVSYLSRKEVTIEEGKDVTGSKDRDFQIDTANYTVAYFFLVLVRLQPLFLAVALANINPNVVADLGGPMIYSWLRALLVAVIIIMVAGIIFLVVWARNIRKPELTYKENGKIKRVAGTEGRDKYPAYRDQLAASALPYCIFIPAMVLALLTAIGQSPQSIAGITGVWFDILFYGLLALFLFGLFVQLPYYNGQTALMEPKFRILRRLEEKIENNIIMNYDNSSKDLRTGLQVIADEITLRRIKEAKHQQKVQSIYRFKLLGESISSTDALASLRGVIVTVLATGAGFLINLWLGIPTD